MIKFPNISKQQASFNIWAGALIIIAGVIFLVPQLIAGIFYPVITAFSLILIGFCTLFFGFRFSKFSHGMVRYLNGGIFIVSGFTMLFYHDAVIQILSYFLGSVLMVNGMFLLWTSAILKSIKERNSLLLTGILSFIAAILLMIPGPFSGPILMALSATYLMIQSGFHWIQFGIGEPVWENEIQFNWNDKFPEEMQLLRSEFFKYRMELMEIQISISAIRDEINQKINIDDIDPEKLRFSRMVSDFQEELKTMTLMTEDFANWSLTEDQGKGMEKIAHLKKIIEGLKARFEEIIEKYPKRYDLHENEGSA